MELAFRAFGLLRRLMISQAYEAPQIECALKRTGFKHPVLLRGSRVFSGVLWIFSEGFLWFPGFFPTFLDDVVHPCLPT